MSPKRYHRKQLIAAINKKKLLKISLKVEDYVYLNKPIPVEDAKRYLQEISECSRHCANNDLASLQVIEKLMRCMKSIINEQEQEVNNSGDMNAMINGGIQNYCPSPVYSLPDEDKTICNDDIAVKEPNVEQVEIDLTEDENYNPIRINTIEKEIHSVIPNSTKINIEKPLKVNNVECSQSILDNFEHSIVFGKSNAQYYQVTQDVNTFLTTSNILLNRELTVSVCNKQSISNVKKPMKNNDAKENKSTLDYYITNANNKTSNTDTKDEHNKNIKRKRNSSKITCCLDNSAIKKPTKPRKNNLDKKQNKKNETVTLKNMTSVQMQKNNKHNIPIKAYLKQDNNTVMATQVDIEASLPLHKVNKGLIITNNNSNSTFVEKTPTFVYNQMDPLVRHSHTEALPIYDKFTENDLSWVENIRYVREIRTEENDPNLAKEGDDFWDNFNLPNCWNDQEFTN